MISKRILENASPLSHDPSDDSTQKRCFLALKMNAASFASIYSFCYVERKSEKYISERLMA